MFNYVHNLNLEEVVAIFMTVFLKLEFQPGPYAASRTVDCLYDSRMEC